MKILLAVIFSVFTLSLVGFGGRTVQAAFDPFQQACQDSKAQKESSVCNDKTKTQEAGGSNSIYGKDGLLSRAITILDIIIGVVAVIMVIVGGFKYVLSGGESNNINSARNTVLYAIIGIVVAVSGQIVVKFVLNRL